MTTTMEATTAQRLDDRAVLDLWDHASGRAGARRLQLLAAAAADEEIDGWSVGRAHASLLALHAALAGPVLEAAAACPSCGEHVEFSLATGEVTGRADGATTVGPVEEDGWHVTWSVITVADYVAAAALDSLHEVRAALLAAAVEDVKGPDGASASVSDLPAGVERALSRALGEADPLLDLLVELRCPGCGELSAVELDPTEHVTAALEARAVRLLDEVHDLASSYGWSEDEVLTLPAPRRAAYLARVRAGAS